MRSAGSAAAHAAELEQPKSRRLRAALAAYGALLIAIALPALLWHSLISDIADRFRWDFQYFVAQWTPWFLLAVGIAFLAPVAFSTGRSPERRFHPRVRRAYFTWGVVLYLLGVLLATQVAQIAALTG